MFGKALFRVRNSISAFANTPGPSLGLVFTIAIGVGNNAIVGGFLSGLAHPRPQLGTSDRIVSIFVRDRLSAPGPLSNREYQAIRSRSMGFVWVNAVRMAPVDVNIQGHPETASVAAIMPDVAKALGLNLNRGAVLSDRLWAADLADENPATPHQLRIDNAQIPITGVAPKTLEGLYRDRPVDVWMPFADDRQESDPDRRDLWVLASLRRGVSLADAQREIGGELKNPDGIDVLPYSGIMPETARGLASIVTLLEFIAASVVLIACINVASLLLGRAFQRSSETSLRVALGATRRALIYELLTDSVVLSLAGGVLGLLLAIAARRVLPNLLFEEDAERLIFMPQVASLVISALVCVLITVLAGMMPILATVTDRPWTVLQREQGSSSTRVVRLRAALVILQIAACCVLVIFAALLLEGFKKALKTGIGQRLGNPILVTVQSLPPPLALPAAYFKAVEQSAKSVPGVVPVAWTTQPPGGRPIWQSFRVEPASEPVHDVLLDVAAFARNSQSQPEQHLTAGRLFEARDGTCRVAVVDNEAAAVLSGGATAGERIFDSAGMPVGIIGVVTRLPNDIDSRRPTIYFDPVSPNAFATAREVRFRAPAALSPAAFDFNVNFVSSGYMQAFGMSLIAGRWFSTPAQFSDPCRRVGVINEEAADLYFGGKSLGAGIIDQNGSRIEIIGIVRSQSLGTFQQHAEPTVFLPTWQENPLRVTLVLKTADPSEEKMAELRRKIESVPGHDVAPLDIKTLDTQLARTAFAALRIATLIALASALAALAVSMIGVFSVQSQVSRDRQKILALHLAFGARGWRILCKALVDSGKLVFLGCAAGALCSIGLQRLLLSGTGLISQPPLRAWLLALLLPAFAVLLSGVVAALRSLRVQPMTIMHER